MIDLNKENCDIDKCDRELLVAEIKQLRAALQEALDFIEWDGCGGNVLVQRLRPLTGRRLSK